MFLPTPSSRWYLMYIFYDAELQAEGFVRQSVTSVHDAVRALPMLVPFTATQKTNATKRTIKVYSTKP